MECVNCKKDIGEYDDYFCLSDKNDDYIINPCCSYKCYEKQEYFLNKWMKISPEDWIIKDGILFIKDINIFRLVELSAYK